MYPRPWAIRHVKALPPGHASQQQRNASSIKLSMDRAARKKEKREQLVKSKLEKYLKYQSRRLEKEVMKRDGLVGKASDTEAPKYASRPDPAREPRALTRSRGGMPGKSGLRNYTSPHFLLSFLRSTYDRVHNRVAAGDFSFWDNGLQRQHFGPRASISDLFERRDLTLHHLETGALRFHAQAPKFYHDIFDVAERVSKVERIIGHKFKDKSLCMEALKRSGWTSPIYFNGTILPIAQNNRIALLGDRITEVALAELWFDTGHSTAQYSLMSSQVSARWALYGRAKALGIDESCLLIHSTVEAPPSEKDLVAEAFEAVIGAVYLDTGKSLDAVKMLMGRLGLAQHEFLKSPEQVKKELAERKEAQEMKRKKKEAEVEETAQKKSREVVQGNEAQPTVSAWQRLGEIWAGKQVEVDPQNEEKMSKTEEVAQNRAKQQQVGKKEAEQNNDVSVASEPASAWQKLHGLWVGKQNLEESKAVQKKGMAQKSEDVVTSDKVVADKSKVEQEDEVQQDKPMGNQQNGYRGTHDSEKREEDERRGESGLSPETVEELSDISPIKEGDQEKLERKRLERERRERRTQKEKLEKERIEMKRQEKREKKKIETEMRENRRKEKKERIEREKLEKEKLEKERIEKEKIEEEKLEKEKLENEKLEKENLEKEKENIEKEKLEKEKLEKEKLEKEKLEKEKLEKEKLEKEKLEKEKLEKEKLEKEKLEKEKLEKEKLEKEKLEKENIEKEKLEKEKLEKEKLEKEKLEKEKLEKEKLEKEKLEKEKLEKEKLEKEKLEKEKLEKEKLEKEKLEKEKLEKEKLEKEKLEKEKFRKEKLEKEKLKKEKLKKERLEKEELKKERREKEKLEREKFEKERREKEKLEKEKLEKEKLEKEKLEKEKLEKEKLEKEKLEKEKLEKEKRLEEKLKEKIEKEKIEEENKKEIREKEKTEKKEEKGVIAEKQGTIELKTSAGVEAEADTEDVSATDGINKVENVNKPKNDEAKTKRETTVAKAIAKTEVTCKPMAAYSENSFAEDFGFVESINHDENNVTDEARPGNELMQFGFIESLRPTETETIYPDAIRPANGLMLLDQTAPTIKPDIVNKSLDNESEPIKSSTVNESFDNESEPIKSGTVNEVIDHSTSEMEVGGEVKTMKEWRARQMRRVSSAA